MIKKIFKYQLETVDTQDVVMPKGAEVLTIQTQNEVPCIWALVNPDEETETRVFEIFGTGHDVYCDMGVDRKYLGTYQLAGGALIFHAFERIN